MHTNRLTIKEDQKMFFGVKFISTKQSSIFHAQVNTHSVQWFLWRIGRDMCG
jgi:hypothetical protein